METYEIFLKDYRASLDRGEDMALAYLNGMLAVEKAAISKGDFTMNVQIEKMSDEQQVAYGWASVIDIDGVPVTDRQGDEISEAELVQAAHNFIKDYRQGKDMHRDSQADGVGCVGTVVESMVFTNDVQKALGIDLGKQGWFIGVKIENDQVLAKVKSGEYKAFSIGGNGERVPFDED